MRTNASTRPATWTFGALMGLAAVAAGSSPAAALTNITAAGLEHLDVAGTQLTDAGLPVFRTFPRLRELNLSHTRVTDGGLPALDGCRRLLLLWLNATAVTESGVRMQAASG